MTTEPILTIDLTPSSSVYSPHVRVMKDFVEELSRLASNIGEFEQHDNDGFGALEDNAALATYVIGQLPSIRGAMSDVLTDDFMLIVDGKRLPGGRRQDIHDDRPLGR